MLAGMICGFLTGLFGWQINLISLHRAMARGRIAGLLVGLGAIAGDLCWITAAFAGSQTLLVHHPEYWDSIKWLGVLTIALVGLKIFFQGAPEEKAYSPATARKTLKSFLAGFLVVIGNPAFLIFWISVIAAVLRANPSWYERPRLFQIFFTAGYGVGGVCWSLLLFGIIFPRIREWTDTRFKFLSKCFAVLLLAGAGILTAKLLSGAF